MSISKLKLFRSFMSVSPGAVVVALAFFTQVFESENSLNITQEYAYGVQPETISDAIQYKNWEKRPKFVINLPKLSAESRWIKFVIPPEESSRNLVAETKFPLLGDIDFYLIDEGQLTDQWHSGYLHPESFAIHNGLYFHYPFASKPTERLLLIRVNNFGTGIPRFSVMDQETFIEKSQFRDKVMGTLFGFSLTIIFVNLALLISQRSLTYLMDIGAQTFLLFVVYLLEGYYKRITPNMWIEPTLLANITITAYMAALFCIAEFYRRHLQLESNFAELSKHYRTVQASYLTAIVIVAITPFAFALSFAVIVSWTSWAWLITRYIRFVKLRSVFIAFVSQSGSITAIIVTSLTIVDIISDNLLNKSMAHLGIIWMGTINLIASGVKLRQIEVRSKRIRSALTRKDSRAELNRLLTSSYENIENIKKAEVTIMFIDAVSFSLLSAGRSASSIFTALSERLSQIVQVIEREGGSVDRSLGDGVLCYFASNQIGMKKHHAVAAFDAAITIQRNTIEAALSDQTTFIMPVRIGIHSADVIIGNLGDEDHLDFTMIGSGVNFASRLETAASPFKINLSTATVDHLVRNKIAKELFEPIKLSIKHHSKLQDAFEHDPSIGSRGNLQTAETKFFEQLGVRRGDERHLITTSESLKLLHPEANFVVQDFSRYGFRAISKTLFGRRTTITVDIKTDNTDLERTLAHNFLLRIVVEVRWSQNEQGQYSHGLRIVGGSHDQRTFLYEMFKKHYINEAASPLLNTTLVS